MTYGQKTYRIARWRSAASDPFVLTLNAIEREIRHAVSVCDGNCFSVEPDFPLRECGGVKKQFYPLKTLSS
ncbi:MAG: hypothetical protein LBJ01_11860 [Tannerella sp.]|jgi:hypothetical protein|nr:hypothetical protein [Tannerella sp.]